MLKAAARFRQILAYVCPDMLCRIVGCRHGWMSPREGEGADESLRGNTRLSRSFALREWNALTNDQIPRLHPESLSLVGSFYFWSAAAYTAVGYRQRIAGFGMIRSGVRGRMLKKPLSKHQRTQTREPCQHRPHGSCRVLSCPS